MARRLDLISSYFILEATRGILKASEKNKNKGGKEKKLTDREIHLYLGFPLTHFPTAQHCSLRCCFLRLTELPKPCLPFVGALSGAHLVHLYLLVSSPYLLFPPSWPVTHSISTMPITTFQNKETYELNFFLWVFIFSLRGKFWMQVFALFSWRKYKFPFFYSSNYQNQVIATDIGLDHVKQVIPQLFPSCH